MLTNRQLFLHHMAQTSPYPVMLEIVRAEGTSLFDVNGMEYTDLISGISVSNTGHRHPVVVNAIKRQLDLFMHLMVYGEYVQTPQVLFAKALCDLLPPGLSKVYFVNSGSEAIEGALKLAKRFTGRFEILCFRNAYHGSTHGALSMMSQEYFRNSFRPLLPGVRFMDYNNMKSLEIITEQTACVVVEMIQGEAGAIVGEKSFLKSLQKKCIETGALLIADEIQTGFGRTGNLFAFSGYGIEPDILVLAKGMGGGMPLGAFISSEKIMSSLMENPVLGHITTFGGHPICCAAGHASLEVILGMDFGKIASHAEMMTRRKLIHPSVISISGKGMMLGIEFPDAEFNQSVIKKCLEKGVITDWFLFAPNKMRIAPPLVITETALERSLDIVFESITETVN